MFTFKKTLIKKLNFDSVCKGNIWVNLDRNFCVNLHCWKTFQKLRDSKIFMKPPFNYSFDQMVLKLCYL